MSFKNNKKVVIALGGNALMQKYDSGSAEEQFKQTRKSLDPLFHFIEKDYNICITHGNGPQVGLELLKNEAKADEIPALPLGVLIAHTQGGIGYIVQQSLQNLLSKKGLEKEVVTFVSQVKVDPNDPKLKNPTKFIGKHYTKELAAEMIEKFNWQMKEQEEDSWRRVVSSPAPQYLFNGNSIKHMMEFGTIVIAAGGGGIPAYIKEDKGLRLVDGVIDKDMTSALLARIVKSEEFFIITDVGHVCLNYGENDVKNIHKSNLKEIKEWLNEGHFKEGTMKPKIEAAIYFLEHHGKKVIITSIDNIENAIKGISGTIIEKV
ncbi:MAG: carbamate kinase [Candidatus Marinimicrobia bacterium]|nr:carbamate kinase [Candidatus Neomarinimicrobiota bacterium]|tara:strand:+ start:6246 stop:7202 length:957 start_codon:yes stop_codon:yes gene_type:complete